MKQNDEILKKLKEIEQILGGWIENPNIRDEILKRIQQALEAKDKVIEQLKLDAMYDERNNLAMQLTIYEDRYKMQTWKLKKLWSENKVPNGFHGGDVSDWIITDGRLKALQGEIESLQTKGGTK